MRVRASSCWEPILFVVLVFLLKDRPFKKHDSVTNYSGFDVDQSLCPLVPPNLRGPLVVNKTVLTEDQIIQHFPHIALGGRHKPEECTSRHKVAIIIPFLNRETHLMVLLNHLLDFLSRQQLDFGLFIIEPMKNSTFNRGKLMNIGMKESLRVYNWSCLIFHDVDLLPENDWNLYSCPVAPRHLSVYIDKSKYIKDATYFGGVNSFSRTDFEEFNGFSNEYWGWGGEDDDLRVRVKQLNKYIHRRSSGIARYQMLQHGKDKQNPINKCRSELLDSAQQRWKSDGLNSLIYKLLKSEQKPLYTHIKVDLLENQRSRNDC